jgi:hypothetical protein
MPYIPGTGRLTDVYHSGNVYANNVPIALWQSPGASGTFGGISVSVSVELDPALVDDASNQVNTYVTSQNGQPGASYSPEAQAAGVKGNAGAGTVNDGQASTSTTTSTVATDASFSDIPAFLTKCLDEAAQGKWRETGQGGKPSNPNITGIWQNLGYPKSSPWTTDQTAWCMGFVNFALKSSGYRYFQTAWAAAITTNPEKWKAVQVPKEQAQPGDIAFWSYRHVNIVYQKKGAGFTFVGGNQTPKGGSNNPDDGDITISYPGGCPPSNGTWVSCWRPSKE